MELPDNAPIGFGAVQEVANYQLSQAWPLVWYGSRGKDPQTIADLWVEQSTSSEGYLERQNLVALVGEEKAELAIEKYVTRGCMPGRLPRTRRRSTCLSTHTASSRDWRWSWRSRAGWKRPALTSRRPSS